MKKKFNIFYIFMVLGLIFIGSQNVASAYDLKLADEQYLFQGEDDVARGFVWGLSPEIIEEYEKGTIVGQTDDGNLFFVDKIFGVRSSIGYLFRNKELSRITIFNEKFYSQPQDRIDDLLTLQSYLTTRYGAPESQIFEWKRTKEKNFPQNWGWALYTGDLEITILWQNKNENVSINLKTEKQFEPKFSLTFERANNIIDPPNSLPENEFLLPIPNMDIIND